jgi:release factor glutamine methyltransferase
MRVDLARARYREEALARGLNPRDVDLILGDLLGKSLPWLLAHGEAEVDVDVFEALLARRYAGEPIQYLRGKTEFYSREFVVDSRVLIPRPETELLVELAIERIPNGAHVVDVGAGSGCISVTLALERPDLRVTAVDRSLAALAVARMNRDRLTGSVWPPPTRRRDPGAVDIPSPGPAAATQNQPVISLIASDVLSAISAPIDAIISNPPYIPERDVSGLATEVRDHEPFVALTPGPRGTEVIERIYDEARERRIPLVMLEIGFGQEAAIHEIAAARGFIVERVLSDLAGIPRVVVSSADADQ